MQEQLDLDNVKELYRNCLSQKHILYTEANAYRYHYRHAQDDDHVFTFSEIVSFLEINNYDFKQSEFDQFITTGTYKRSNSYIIYKSPYTKNEKAIEILFTKFTPNDKQIKTLLNCYTHHGSVKYDWIDVLVKKNFQFSKEYRQRLLEIGYDVTQILHDGDVDMTTLENILSNKLDTAPFSKLKIIINKIDITTNPLPTTCLYNFINDHVNEIDTWSIFEYFINIINLLLENGAIITIDVINVTINKYERYSFDTIRTFSPYIGKEDAHKHLPANLLDVISLQDNLSTRQCMSLLFLIEHGFTANINIINKLLRTTESITNSNVKQIFPKNAVPKKYWLDQKSHDTFNFFKYYKNKKITPNMETLKIACNKCDIQFFEDIIAEKNKIQPNKECLDAALNGLYKSRKNGMIIIQKILDYKIVPDKESYMSLQNLNYEYQDISGLNELLIHHGLTVNSEIINKALSIRCPIYDLYRFGIEYDEKLYLMCHKNNIMPEKYVEKFNETIGKNIVELRLMFRSRKWPTIVKFMKSNNIKPDRYCFENCCTNKNYQVAQEMRDLKCTGTKRALCFFMDSNTTDMFNDLYGNIVDENDNPEAMAKVYDHIDLDKL